MQTRISSITIIIVLLNFLVHLGMAEERNFDSTQFETWTTPTGAKLEARLVNVTEQGHYVLLNKENKKAFVKPEMLNEASRERAAELVTAASVQATPEEEGYAETSNGGGSAGGGSFFGIPINSSSQTPPPTYKSDDDEPLENHTLVNSKWQGPSPFRQAKNEQTTVSFETANRLRWSVSSGEYYMEYKKNSDSNFQVARKFPIIINIIDSETEAATMFLG